MYQKIGTKYFGTVTFRQCEVVPSGSGKISCGNLATCFLYKFVHEIWYLSLAFHNFDKAFELDYDALYVNLEAVYYSQ